MVHFNTYLASMLSYIMEKGWDREEDYERVRNIAENFGRSPDLSEKELAILVGFGNVEISDNVRQSFGELKEHLTEYHERTKSHEQLLEESICIMANRLEMERNDLSERVQRQVAHRIEDFKKELDLIKKGSSKIK